MERQNISERVDHRSYERQELEQIPTVHMGVAATQMERRGIVTERGNMNREIAVRNNLLRQILAKLKQFKDWLKEAIAPAAHNSREEKPSVMAQLNKYKEKIAETINTEPSALAELRARFNIALENLKRIDWRLKNAKGLEEFDKIIVERRRAYQEYSALKIEVKKAERSLPQRKSRSKERER